MGPSCECKALASSPALPALESGVTPLKHTAHASARYHTDPSGTYVQYKAMAIGSGSEGAQSSLQEHFKPDMTIKEAEVLALSTLKQVMEEKVGTREQLQGTDHNHGSGVFSREFPCCLHRLKTVRNSGGSHSPFMGPYPAAPKPYVGPVASSPGCWLNQSSVCVCVRQVTGTNVDMARVSPTYHIYTAAEVEEVMARL